MSQKKNIMKKVFAIAVATIITATSFAQKGGIFAYGNLGFSSSTDAAKNKSSYTVIAPGVGYNLDKNWAVGVSLGLSSSSVKNDAGTELSKGNNFQAGAFARYTKSLSNIFSVYGQLDAMMGQNKTGVGVETKTNSFSVGVTPAVQVNVNKHWAMNLSFGGLMYNSSKIENAANSSSNFIFNFGSNSTIGIQYNF